MIKGKTVSIRILILGQILNHCPEWRKCHDLGVKTLFRATPLYLCFIRRSWQEKGLLFGFSPSFEGLWS